MEYKSNDEKTISQILLHWLLVIMGVAFVFSTVVLFVFQTRISERNTEKILRQNLADVVQDIQDASDTNLLALASFVATYYDNDYVEKDDYDVIRFAKEAGEKEITERTVLEYLAYSADVEEVMIVNRDGIIADTSSGEYVGFDMASGEQSAEFLCLLDGKTEYYVQDYGPISADGSISRKFAGWRLDKKGGFIQVSYGAERFQSDIAEEVYGITKNRHVGASGGVIIADEKGKIVSGNGEYIDKQLEDVGFSLLETEIESNSPFRAIFSGKKCDCIYDTNEGYYIIAVLPCREMYRTRNYTVAATVIFEFFVYLILYMGIMNMLRKEVTEHIDDVTNSLDRIAEGDLENVLDVHGNREFVSLSKDINKTVSSLKKYIAAESERIETELGYAKSIQASALPSVFPPYPDKTAIFDIYATMKPAREVGGDFYDFFLVGNDRLAFTVADVSGKGIPAALFMMRAKALIKSSVETDLDVGEVLTSVNHSLCEGNRTGMFVTAWLGILNLDTGVLEYANAGHNRPLIRTSGGTYEYVCSKANFILAGIDGIEYCRETVQLSHGDEIFAYTDGVTEATTLEEQLYGDDRLRDILNASRGKTSREICEAVQNDIERFTGNAAQFDDITMLSIKYK